jgi:hypothetical protein
MICDSDCECLSLKELIANQELLPSLEIISRAMLNIDKYPSLKGVTAYQQGVEDGYAILAKLLAEVLSNG